MLCVSCVCKIDWHSGHRLSPMTSPAELPWRDQGRQEQGGPQGAPGTVPSASVSSPGAELHCYVDYLVAHLCLTGNERAVLGAFNLIKHTRVTTEKGMVPQDRVGIVAWSGFVITLTPCPPPSCFLPQLMCQLTQKTGF